MQPAADSITAAGACCTDRNRRRVLAGRERWGVIDSWLLSTLGCTRMTMCAMSGACFVWPASLSSCICCVALFTQDLKELVL